MYCWRSLDDCKHHVRGEINRKCPLVVAAVHCLCADIIVTIMTVAPMFLGKVMRAGFVILLQTFDPFTDRGACDGDQTSADDKRKIILDRKVSYVKYTGGSRIKKPTTTSRMRTRACERGGQRQSRGKRLMNRRIYGRNTRKPRDKLDRGAFRSQLISTGYATGGTGRYEPSRNDFNVHFFFSLKISFI